MKDTVQAHIKRISKLLEDPARWTQRALARHKNGNAIGPQEKQAVCFCLSGAEANTSRSVCSSDTRKVILDAIHFIDGYKISVPNFNDSSEHAEVMHVLDIALIHAQGAEI